MIRTLTGIFTVCFSRCINGIIKRVTVRYELYVGHWAEFIQGEPGDLANETENQWYFTWSSGLNMASVEAAIRYFDMVIDGRNLIDEVFPILETLRPKWTKGALCEEKYSEGYVNAMCCVYQKSDTKRQDALVVRVYGIEIGTMLTRDKEFLNLQIGHVTGCFPAIVASFQNGLIYKYEPGRTMTFKDLNAPETIKTIVHTLYKLIHVDFDSLSLVNRKGEPVSYDRNPRTFLETAGFIKMIPAETKDETKKEAFKKCRLEVTDEYLNKEYEYVQDVLEVLKLPMSFSHGDFHPRNMVINDETGKVTFIDYEMSGFHYDGIDIVNLFGCRGMFDVIGVKIDECDDKNITPESRELYAREYVEAKKEGDETENDEIINDKVDLTLLGWRILEIVMKFQILVMGLAFVDTEFNKKLDLVKVVEYVRGEYEKKRGELHSLRDKYLAVRNRVQCEKKWTRDNY